MKRKMILVVMTTALLVGACGSGQTAQPTSGTDTESPVSEAVSETETTSETPSSETEASAADTEAVGVIEVSLNTPVTVNGQDLELTGNAEDGGDLVVSYKGEEYTVGYSDFNGNAYLIPGEDDAFRLLVQASYYNDYGAVYSLSYSDSQGMTMGSGTDGTIQTSSDIEADGVWLNGRIDVLGTWGYRHFYRYSGDDLVSDSSRYDFINEADPSFWDTVDTDRKDELSQMYDEEGRRILTLTQDLTASDTTTGETITIPSGSHILPIACEEDASCFYFTYEDTEYSLTYERNDNEYTISIDGVDQYNLFAILPYAG